MRKRAATLGILVLVSGLFSEAAWADDIYLKNGNLLSGKLVSVGNGQLILETAFAGKLTIDWNHVERIKMEGPVTVVMKDGSILKGTMTSTASAGQIVLSTSSITQPTVIELASVNAINPPEAPAVKLSGRVNFGLNKATGNTETENIHGDGKLVARAVKHRFTVGAEYNWAEEDNKKSEDNATGYLKHDYFLTKKVFWNLNGMLETDKFKDINLRTTAGTGLGYQIFEGELMNLHVEAGPSYVNTDYDKGDDEDHWAGRWAVAFDRFFFDMLFQYYFSNESYISVSDTSDILMYTKTGTRFPIRGGFFLNLGWEWDWDHKPAEDTKESDYRYIVSLGYGF
jgi:putative salt-induced outer membrane protein YdiY